jgi:hypothetical protein
MASKLGAFIGSECSLHFPQQPATGPYPEADEFIPHTYIPVV